VHIQAVSDGGEGMLMAMLETNDDGALYLPPELIGAVGPHTRFELEIAGDTLMLRPANRERPFWRQATPQQRAEGFRLWAAASRPSTPDLSDESLRRENLYD
jgi:hypothetical protein